MKQAHNITRVSVERIASGSGLVNAYDFLCHAFPDRVNKEVDDGEGCPCPMCFCSVLVLRMIEDIRTHVPRRKEIVCLLLSVGALYLF